MKKLLSIAALLATTVLGLGQRAVSYNPNTGGLTVPTPAILRPALQLGYVNVKDSPYLAIGDNVNDDTAEIQAAMDAAPIGGTVFIPPGNYKITAALTLNVNRLQIIGAGRGSTTLRFNPAAASALFNVPTNKDSLYFSDITLYNTVPASGGRRVSGVTQTGTATTEVTFERVNFQAFTQDAINFAAALYVNIHGCRFLSNNNTVALGGSDTTSATCITIGSDANAISIQKCRFSFNDRVLLLPSTISLDVSDNSFEFTGSVTRAGWTQDYLMDIGSVQAFGVSIRNNYFERETTSGTTPAFTAAASTNLITSTAHGMGAGNTIFLSTLTGGAGLSAGNTTYYVIASGLTANDFKVSTVNGGTEVDITTDGTAGTWAFFPWTGKSVILLRNARAPQITSNTFYGDYGGTVYTHNFIEFGSGCRQSEVSGNLFNETLGAFMTVTGSGEVVKAWNNTYLDTILGTPTTLTTKAQIRPYITISKVELTGDFISRDVRAAQIVGGINSGDDLTLLSTEDAGKGNIYFGTAATYDQNTDRLGIGTLSPDEQLDAVKTGVSAIKVQSTSTTGTRDAALKLYVPNTGTEDPAGSLRSYAYAGETEINRIEFITKAAGTGGQMLFKTHDGTTLAEKMRFDDNGDMLVVNDIVANSFSGDGSNLTSIAASNVTGPFSSISLTGTLEREGAQILIATTSGGTVIDTLKGSSSRTITAPTTFTFNSDPPTGTRFELDLTPDIVDRVIDIPSSFSFEAGGAVTSFTQRANQPILLLFKRLASSYQVIGVPVADILGSTITLAEGGSTATPAAATSKVYVKADGLWYGKDDAGTETALSNVAGGGAPTTATYITQTADAGLSAEQAMGALATGIVKNTTATGMQSIAVAGTDYAGMGANTFTANQTITGDILPSGNLGSAAAPALATYTGNTTQYESVTQTANTITHAALGSATNIDIAFSPKGGGTLNSAKPLVITGSATISGNVSTGSATAFIWAGSKSQMRSPSDGIIKFNNDAVSDFNRLQLGGETSSFPAVARATEYINIVDAAGGNTSGLQVNSGTPLLGLLSAAAAIDFASMLTGTEDTQTITVTGVATTNTPSVVLGWSATLEAGISVSQAWVSGANTVSIRVRNNTAGTVDPASLTVRATVSSF